MKEAPKEGIGYSCKGLMQIVRANCLLFPLSCPPLSAVSAIPVRQQNSLCRMRVSKKYSVVSFAFLSAALKPFFKKSWYT